MGGGGTGVCVAVGGNDVGVNVTVGGSVGTRVVISVGIAVGETAVVAGGGRKRVKQEFFIKCIYLTHFSPFLNTK